MTSSEVEPVWLTNDTSIVAFTSEAESVPILPRVPLIFTEAVSALTFVTT